MGSVSRRVATGEVMSALSGADFFQKHVFLASVRIKGPDHVSLYFLTLLRHACESSTTIVREALQKKSVFLGIIPKY